MQEILRAKRRAQDDEAPGDLLQLVLAGTWIADAMRHLPIADQSLPQPVVIKSYSQATR